MCSFGIIREISYTLADTMAVAALGSATEAGQGGVNSGPKIDPGYIAEWT